MPRQLDVSGIAADPCSALTKEQISTFPGTLAGTRVTQTTSTGKGKSCGWTFDGERYSLGTLGGGLVLPSDRYHGLSSLYRSKSQGGMSVFHPVGPIAGYPAVIYASGRTIGDGFCRLAVGLRNDTAYRITTELSSNHPAEKDPCKVAKKVAEFVVQNLKQG